MKHGDCKYFGFRGLEHACRHPQHPGALWDDERCADYLDHDTKVLPGMEKTWPDPLPTKEAP